MIMHYRGQTIAQIDQRNNLTTPINRRNLVRRLVVTAAVAYVSVGGAASVGDAVSAAADDSAAMRAILLSNKGGDRATAYGMSGKVVSRQGQYLLCSWLDVARQNQWALVNAKRGEIVRRGTVGPPRRDNHCGAALCAAPDGTTHCIVGAHGGSFMHYCMPAGEDRATWHLMEEAIGQGATYGSSHK